MRNRFWDAYMIHQGACNPSGIAHSLIKACEEIRNEGGGTQTTRDDPAVRLMVHQLAYLCDVGNTVDFPDWNSCIEICQQKAEPKIEE